jgi:NADH dehydrogenase [ubiquinone] 1 alpha subcomplex assembly factor 7
MLNQQTISIADFVEFLLFNKQNGYYINKNPIGNNKDGDFITAPEISGLFGEMLAVYLLNLFSFQQEPVVLVEMGAGRGTLMFDVLNTIKKLAKTNEVAKNFWQKCQVAIVEISPILTKIQQQKLTEFNIAWYTDFTSFLANYKQKIFFFSNELFDCFAINQYIKTKQGWQIRMISFEGELENHNFNNLQFVLADFCPKNHSFVCQILGQEIANSAPINAVFEYAPKAHIFANELATAIKTQGAVAINIDYGYEKYEFANTLQVLKNQQKHNFLTSCKNADITALVDFILLQKVAKQHNLQCSLISQGEFLQQLGIITRAEILQKNHPQKAKQISIDVARLIDFSQMGDLCKVLIWW